MRPGAATPCYGQRRSCCSRFGSVLIIAVLFFLMAYFVGGRLSVWMTARPGRVAAVASVALIVAGFITVLYGDVRLLARRGIIPMYPVAPWAA